MLGSGDLPGRGLLGAQAVLLWAAFAIIAVGGAVLARRWLGAPRPPGWRRQAAGLAALGLFALGLRLFVSPHTLLTENAHGYELLRSAFTFEGYAYYGTGYYAFFYPVTALLGRRPEVVFTVNALLGTVAALVLVPLGRRLAGRAEAGWLAAVAYACWPAVLWLSAGETPYPLGICCALLAWLAWLRAWETGETLRFVLAAALLAVAVQARPELAPWGVVLLLGLPLSRGFAAHLRRRGPWVAALIFVALISEWAAFRVTVQRADGVPGFLYLSPRAYFPALVSSDNLLLRADWTPVVAWALAPLGVVALAVRRWRALPALLGGYLVLGWMVMAVHTDDFVRLRLQSPLHPLVALAVGAGVAAVAERLEGRARSAAVVLLGAALVASAALRFPRVRAPYDPQLEYAFLARTVRALPDGCAVITMPRTMADGHVVTEFPVWWLRGPFEYADRVRRDPRILEHYPCRLFYRGLSCYQFVPGEPIPPDGVRPECRAVEGRGPLTPYAEVTFPSRPTGFHRTGAPRLTLGFYRLGR